MQVFSREEEIKWLVTMEKQLMWEEKLATGAPKFEIPSNKQGMPSSEPPQNLLWNFFPTQLSIPNTISLFKGGPVVWKAN